MYVNVGMAASKAGDDCSNPILRKLYHPVTGEWIYMHNATKEIFEAAVNFQAKEDDIFICTFPKSGTTWLQYIVWLITHGGESYYDGKRGACMSKLEFDDPEAIENLNTRGHQRIITTHLPADFAPYQKVAKYLYIARNPKDQIVSRSYYFKGFKRNEGMDCSVSTMYKYHMLNETSYNNQCDHIGGWYLKRNESNVLFLMYKDLKSDLKREVKKIAKFLGHNYLQEMEENDECLLKKVVDKASFSSMAKMPGSTWVSTFAKYFILLGVGV